MTAEQIVELVFRILTIIGYVTLAILAIKRKKPTVIDNGDNSEDEDNLIDGLLGFIVAQIKDAEDKGNLLSGKSGFFKFDRVLSRAQEYCRSVGLKVDTKYLTDRIEGLVKLMNYKSESKSDVQSIGQINYEEVQK